MNNGMLYKRQSFTVPASETRETDVCEIEGAHIPSGPAKRRNCLRCGTWLPKEEPLKEMREILDAVGTPADMGGDIVSLLTKRELSQEMARRMGGAPVAPATISTLSETYKRATEFSVCDQPCPDAVECAKNGCMLR